MNPLDIGWKTFRSILPDTTYHCLVSELPVDRVATASAFLMRTAPIQRQLKEADGLVGYALRAKPLAKRFWTLSAWHDVESLKAFTLADPHKRVMAELRPCTTGARFVTFEVAGAALPLRLDDEIGRLS